MPFSLNALIESQSRSSGELWYCLATIQHPTFAQPFRLVSPRVTPLISDGRTFNPSRFDVVFPSDQFDEQSRASVVYEGVSGIILTTLQGLRPRPLVTFEIVTESDPDEILFTAPNLEISNLIQEGLTSTSLELEAPRAAILPFPGINMDRVRMPGMFTDL